VLFASPKEDIRTSLPTETIKSASFSTMVRLLPEGAGPSSKESVLTKRGSVFEESSTSVVVVGLLGGFGGENMGWSSRVSFQSLSEFMRTCFECSSSGYKSAYLFSRMYCASLSRPSASSSQYDFYRDRLRPFSEHLFSRWSYIPSASPPGK